MKALDHNLIVFFQLIRVGIGTDSVNKINTNNLDGTDWKAIRMLSDNQGLSALVLDGIDLLNTKNDVTIPVSFKLNWIGEVLQNYEQRYKAYEDAIASLAGFYNQHGYKMMVLKGYSCSLDWPKPIHRPCGDIDIWQFGKWKEADSALSNECGIKIDRTHHHHTVFNWKGFTVENHYDFLNVHHHKSNVELNSILKRLGQDDSNIVKVKGESVVLPSPNLNALFLLRHNMKHFASERLTMRQLLDWGLFVRNHSNEIDWKWLEKELERFGMKRMYDIFIAICVGDLGFDANLFPKVQFDPGLKDRVLNEIITPEFTGQLPKGFFKRVLFKYKRWRANSWKHELCYKESMWSAFWSGVWSHTLKPTTI